LIDFFLIFSAHDEIFFPLPETEGRKKWSMNYGNVNLSVDIHEVWASLSCIWG
jgi:hypothetical protein